MGGSEAEAKNNLGFAYERRGDLGNAYDLYLEALRLDPAGRQGALEPGPRRRRPRPPRARRGSARAPAVAVPARPASAATPAPAAETPRSGADRRRARTGAAPPTPLDAAAADSPRSTHAPLSNDTPPPKTPKREAKP